MGFAISGATLGVIASVVQKHRGLAVIIVMSLSLLLAVHYLSRRSLVQVAILALLLGAWQGPMTTIAPTRIAFAVDDLVVAILCAWAVMLNASALRRMHAELLVLVAFAVVLAAAILRSTDTGLALYQARQLAVPALLLLIGLLMSKKDFRPFYQATILISAALSVYIIVEVLFGPPIDPLPSRIASAFNRTNFRDGLPGYYFYYGLTEMPLRRAGGFFLNPPTSGVFLGTAIPIILHAGGRFRMRIPLILVSTIALLLTLSRGGILLAAGGCILPLLIRRFGPALALTFSTIGALAASMSLLSHGSTSRHVDGLTALASSLRVAPFGRGFGAFGNAARQQGLDVIGHESLLGIFVAAAGIPALLIIVALASRLYLALRGHSAPWAPALGLAGLTAAALSESAGALDGGFALWLVTGSALAVQSAQRGIAQAGKRHV